MKTYTKDQLFGEIYLNENAKFTSTKWGEDKYITQKDGQIIDNKGKAFNLMTAKDNEWTLWTEPKQNTDTITKEEALKALYSGKRVKALEWDNEALEVKDGQILLNESKPFNIMAAKEKDWVIIEECDNSKYNPNDIAEVKAMLEKLLAKDNAPYVPETGEEAKAMGFKLVKDGRSIEAQENTTDILKDVYGVSTPKEVQAQFKEKLENAHSTLDIEKAVCEYIPYCWIGNRKLGTTSVYYSNMRKVIKELKNDDYRETGLNLFVAPQSVYETVQAKITENKKEEIRNKNTFVLEDVKDVIKNIKHSIEVDNFEGEKDPERQKAYFFYSYLTIVTGRRQAEILRTLKIKKVQDTWQYLGITKDRKKGKSIEAFSIENDFEFLNELLNYVQKFVQKEIEETINNKLRKIDNSEEREKLKIELERHFSETKSINSKFNSTFSPAITRITGMSYTPRMWRGIYAEILWVEKGQKEGSHIDKRDFKAKVLGHKYDGKLSTTEHYDSSWEAV